MYIADSFIDHGRVYAACSGSGIKDGMTIKRIKAGDDEFDVSTCQVVKSFIGIPQALLELSGKTPPPLGEITLLA